MNDQSSILFALPAERTWPAGKGPHGFCLVLVLLALLPFLAVFSSPGRADPAFPALTGRVVDTAGLLDKAARQGLAAKLRQLEEKTTDQLVVVTIADLQGYSIDDFGVRLARHWQIGQKDKNNGVLLLVAPKERKVRIEVGYGLEGVLTDTLAGNIVHNRILPLFRRGKMSQGIATGVDDIIAVLTGDAKAVAERARGGGARSGEDRWILLFFMFIWGAIVSGIMWKAFFGNATERGGVIIVPVGEAAGQWNNDGFGNGGRGGFGGGFSGGGGSFGGGGASGGW